MYPFASITANCRPSFVQSFGRGSGSFSQIDLTTCSGAAPWRSIAIDPGVIPYGSRVFIPAFCTLIGHAWFRAEDHGGAIIGRHIDVYRNPPPKPNAYRDVPVQRVYVLPPKVASPAGRPTCATYVPPGG